MNQETDAVLQLLGRHEEQILTEWLQEAGAGSSRTTDAGRRSMRSDAEEILRGMRTALQAGADPEALQAAPWAPVRGTLESLSRSRAAQGQSAGDTSQFVLAFKRPLFGLIQNEFKAQPERQMAVVWAVSSLVDRMAQWTVSSYQQTREELIKRQQQDLLELSTPVIKLFEGVLAVPMIGTLDSSRTQVVMETLLQRIVDTGSRLAIIDITGVPTVDTLVAQHLLKTVAAARLMGAECIISGIRPQIAQTIVHLGVELGDVTTKATLADAFAVALRRNGMTVAKVTG
jgi:rsbT co-antagonist protein RsbR